MQADIAGTEPPRSSPGTPSQEEPVGTVEAVLWMATVRNGGQQLLERTVDPDH